MTIAKVSKEYGLTLDTLRYYERIRLIPAVGRNKSGIRDYKEDDWQIRWKNCSRQSHFWIRKSMDMRICF